MQIYYALVWEQINKKDFVKVCTLVRIPRGRRSPDKIGSRLIGFEKLHLNPWGSRRQWQTFQPTLLATTLEHAACSLCTMQHILYLKYEKYYTNELSTQNSFNFYYIYFQNKHAKKLSLLCIYWTTFGVRPCLESVINTSAALFRQGTLWFGHQLVMAENSRVKSSFLASSSAGEEWLHSLTSTFTTKSLRFTF